ncbi:MAG: flagellar filament capping protein FliD, partial [Deltaproteobacteria bacterium]|nr:flagellar filament capping protein FliD [Deltaproteobacteria bacterium]
MALSTNLIAGLSSGFDWRTMIDQLIAIEHRRVDVVEDRKADYEAQLSEWQSFNTKLLALKTAAEGLNNPKDFYLYTASMSTDSSTVDAEDLLSISTTTSAVPGTYTIKVTNLAQAQKLASNPFTSQTAELGSSYAGDIIINGKVVTINATDSLGDVADSINSVNTGTDPSGVTATVVNYGTNDYRLILTSDETGDDGMSLLNGSSANLVQKFGWKDNETAIIKNSITNGAQSDRFTSPNVAIKSLLGLSTGEASTGSLTIAGTAVTINLSTDSLTDIKDTINNASITGVTASVISQTVDGTTYYRLQIDGTQTFVDEKNILNTLGILDHTSVDVTGKVSENSMTSEGTYITSTTLLTDIDGYNTFTAGDYIRMSGTDTAGSTVGGATGYVDFTITSSSTVQDLLDEIENQYGDVVAYVTSTGKIRVDDLTGGTNLVVNLADNIQDANSSLEFVTNDGDFLAATARKREVVAGEDATVEIDGVEVTNSSNTIEDVIEGVTLNLVKEDSSTTVTLKIEHDIDTIKSNIQDFVDKYNDVMSYINTQFSYDEDSETTGGVLFGDSTLRSVKSDVVSLLTKSIWGVDSDFSSLSLVGIDSEQNEDDEWVLSIDDTKLTGYLQTNFSDVMSLFVGQGITSTSALTYIAHTRDSEAGEYTVHINRAATRGTETGNVDLSSGGADETLTITQGNSTAEITITSGMTLADIKNAINAELDTEYAETLVGDVQLKEDDNVTYITSETTWDNIYGTTFQNDDVISFSGTSRSGSSISGSYTISDVTTDTVQGLLSAIEDAFSSEVTATIDTSGRIVVTDKYVGYSELSISSISHPTEGEFFGTVDVTSGAGDGSQEGRYAMAITATDDGSNHLVLRSDDYGSISFTISQDTTDGNYDHIIYTTTSNTTDSTSGTVYITSSTKWNDVYGANVANNDTITISGKARDGTTDISGTYTITDITTDTINGLLTAIESAYSDQGTTVDAFIRDGKIYVEDTTAGSSSISLTLTCNNEGGGSLALGTFDQTTERDLDLGLINGTVTGQDVAGTINGEAATGSGQVLTGDDGNTNTDGLSIRYKGTSNDTDVGTITLTLGVAELFERTLFNITDSVEDGYVAFKQDSLQDRISDLEDDIQEMEARLDRKMERMINQFVAMELALA